LCLGRPLRHLLWDAVSSAPVWALPAGTVCGAAAMALNVVTGSGGVAAASGDPDTPTPTIRTLMLVTQRGQCTAIVGPVTAIGLCRMRKGSGGAGDAAGLCACLFIVSLQNASRTDIRMAGCPRWYVADGSRVCGASRLSSPSPPLDEKLGLPAERRSVPRN